MCFPPLFSVNPFHAFLSVKRILVSLNCFKIA